MRIRGRCLKIEHTDMVTGTTTFLLLDYDKQEEIRVLGVHPDIVKDTQYTMDGQFHQDGTFRFGKIRRMSDCRQESINLLSDCVKGVSKSLAEEIVDLLGEDIYEYSEIPDLKDVLCNVPGIGPKKANAVVEFIYKGTQENKLFQFLCEYQVPYVSILQILGTNPPITIADIKKDPYLMMKYDVSFDICDMIAVKNGIDPWEFGRIDALFRCILKRMHANGDTRMEFEKFIKAVSRYSYNKGKSTVGLPVDLIEIIAYSTGYLKIYKEGNKRYVSSILAYLQERDIVRNIDRIEQYRQKHDIDLGKLIKQTEQAIGVTYNDEQRKVFEIIREGGVEILTGGPGTGKTTVINGIIKAYLTVHPEEQILLCAPTGRAAARMTEISKHTAKTMHKAMNLRWYGERKCQTEPLEYGLIVVDEMSMCDTEIFSIFMKATVSGASILLSGDYNQIPSVEPGQVFRDLVESKKFRTCKLIKTVRQEEGSLIIDNSMAILKGQTPKAGPEFQIAIAPNDNTIYNTIKRLDASTIPQILCPIKKTVAGTGSLNLLVQEKQNLEGRGIWLDGLQFHIGDKVIMNENNYEAGYMNGDVGEIREILNGSVVIQFTDKKLRIAISDLDGINLAYALTFHKSQGAECENVLIVLPEKAKVMASRELLYTAVTRAKKKVWLIATDGVLESYLAAAGRSHRECGLRAGLEGKINYND